MPARGGVTEILEVVVKGAAIMALAEVPEISFLRVMVYFAITAASADSVSTF